MASPARLPLPSPGWIALAVAALLALHATLALRAVAGKSVTADELLHVTHGFFVDRYGDHRIQPENGVLPQRLHGLAACWSNAPLPPLEDNEYWRTATRGVVAHQFFYETGHDHFPMLMGARALNLLFSLGTGLLAFVWARRLAGPAAGVVALGFYALDPNLLAHAALATSDLAATFFLLAAVTAFWWQLAAPSLRRMLASATIFGLACTAKYSAVLLLPVFLLLIAARIWLEPPSRRSAWLGRTPVLLGLHAVGAAVIIWAFFGFRYSGFSPALPPADHYTAPWATVLPLLGWQGPLIGFARDWHLLPEAFLYGYAWVAHSLQTRAAFLAGHYSVTGWTEFFPLAFLWKTTPALLLGLSLAALALWRSWWTNRELIRTSLIEASPLLVLLIVYVGFSLTSHLNIGHRHLLPIYPVLFVLVAFGLVTWARPRLVRLTLPLALLAGQAISAAAIAPNYLAYFNGFAGGPDRGWRLLTDSSLDWGQDLPGLKTWLARENPPPAAQPVYLSYFGSGEPAYYGITATRLPFVNGFKFVHSWYEPGPGIYCVSATMLSQVYSPVQGPWTLELEREYQTLRQAAPALREAWRQQESTWLRYDALRFARLCHYLRARRPNAVIGYSIFIHRLTQAEVDAVLNGNYSRWLQAIENLPASDR